MTITNEGLKTEYKGYTIEVTGVDRWGRLEYKTTSPTGTAMTEWPGYLPPKSYIDREVTAAIAESEKRDRLKQMRSTGKIKPKKPILTEFVHNGKAYDLEATYYTQWYGSKDIRIKSIRGMKSLKHGEYKVWVSGTITQAGNRGDYEVSSQQVDLSRIRIVGFEAPNVEEITAKKAKVDADLKAITVYDGNDTGVELVGSIMIITAKDKRVEIPLKFEDAEIVGYDAENEPIDVLARAMWLVKGNDKYDPYFTSQADADNYTDLAQQSSDLHEKEFAAYRAEKDIVKAILKKYQAALDEWEQKVYEWEAAKEGWS